MWNPLGVWNSLQTLKNPFEIPTLYIQLQGDEKGYLFGNVWERRLESFLDAQKDLRRKELSGCRTQAPWCASQNNCLNYTFNLCKNHLCYKLSNSAINFKLIEKKNSLVWTWFEDDPRRKFYVRLLKLNIISSRSILVIFFLF